MGHSAGGVFTQQLMDRGYGAAGVAINSAPPRGVKPCLSRGRVELPGRSRRTLPTGTRRSGSAWSNGAAFTNTFSEEEARRLCAHYRIPASGGDVFWGSALAKLASIRAPARRRPRVELPELRAGRRLPFHLGERGSPHAPDDAAFEREALQGGRNDHGGQGVRGRLTTSCPRRRDGEGRSPTTP